MTLEFTHEENARRLEAHRILESIEELFWAAEKRNDTVPQTRLYFQKIIAGFDPETPAQEYPEGVWGDPAPLRLDPGIDPRTRGGEVKHEGVEMRNADEGVKHEDVRIDSSPRKAQEGSSRVAAGEEQVPMREVEAAASEDRRKRSRRGRVSNR